MIKNERASEFLEERGSPRETIIGKSYDEADRGMTNNRRAL
jgi:hypothetical protein